MPNDLPTDVAQLQADLSADRETIRLLATQLVKRERRYSLLDLCYLAARGTFRPTQKLRAAMQMYRANAAGRPKPFAIMEGRRDSPVAEGHAPSLNPQAQKQESAA
jgi:hypothetical protein